MAGAASASVWSERVIPLPKEMLVLGSARVQAGRIAVACDADPAPQIRTALDLLRPFCRGYEPAEFTIRLTLAGDARGVSSDLRERLSSLPNADQAYAIVPSPGDRELLLIANTPNGLLYAARTLGQLVGRPRRVGPETAVEIPLVCVTDWPDIAERGQWGGDTSAHIASTSALKLNLLEENAGTGIDSSGKPTVRIKPSLVRQGSELGTKVVPFIAHLEQLSGYSGVKDRKEILSTPDPSKPLPSDYVAGLCMSSPATREVVRGWLDEIAKTEHVTDIMVWLSEDRAPCFCDTCKGKEPFELEVACILGAFRDAQASHPRLRLRLLTTQGSYPVNDKVLAAAPPDVGISYYDGGRTYDSSRRPMIYPLLADFAKSGRWLGVYPQITHSWRVVFPWTAPQFIRYRAQEFADKKLSCVVGYAVPGNRYHDFNVAALAEWTWNAHGRSVEEFARAYAVHTGIDNPGLFARWALLAGEAGWALAESRLMLTAIYNPSLGLGSGVPFDHRFQSAGISAVGELEKAISTARDALALARESANADMICESECALAGLEAFAAMGSAFPLLSSATLDETRKAELAASLDRLDASSSMLRNALLEWGSRIARGGAAPGRLLDTAFALLRTSDAFRAKAVALGVSDPRPESRMRKLRDWSQADFPSGPAATLSIDLTDLVPEGGGEFQVGFDFVESAYGTDVKSVLVFEENKDSEREVARAMDPGSRVSKWERWKEYRVRIPARAADTQLTLKVGLSGPPADAPADRRSCAGSVGLRQILGN